MSPLSIDDAMLAGDAFAVIPQRREWFAELADLNPAPEPVSEPAPATVTSLVPRQRPRCRRTGYLVVRCSCGRHGRRAAA